jgi:hypothetical protein
MIDVIYKTRRGSSMIKRMPNMVAVEVEFRRLFKARTEARCRKDGETVGEVYKRPDDGRWDWWCETDEMQQEESL